MSLVTFVMTEEGKPQFNKTLHVRNFPFRTTKDQLFELFKPYGKVEDVRIADRKGYGFVDFRTPEEAKSALDGLNGKEFGGRPLTIEYMKNKERPRRERNWEDDRRRGRYNRDESYERDFRQPEAPSRNYSLYAPPPRATQDRERSSDRRDK